MIFCPVCVFVIEGILFADDVISSVYRKLRQKREDAGVLQRKDVVGACFGREIRKEMTGH